MQQKNTPISILRKFEDMPAFLYKGRFLIAILFATLLLMMGSCKKPSLSDPAVQQYFNTNLLNRNFVIVLASDSGVNITDKYAQDTFVLSRQDTASYYNGIIKGSKKGVIYTGTWSSNSDFSKLTINLYMPSTPEEFVFLNRSWRFASKALPLLQLTPWGSTDPKVLHMLRL